jgi:hypothetical protein
VTILIFFATWILLAGRFFFGGLRGGPVPFMWLFWSTNLTRDKDGIGFWIVLVGWLALFICACAGFLLTCIRALTGAHPFDQNSFWPSSVKDMLAAAIFSLLFFFVLWITYRDYRVRRLFRDSES